MAATKMTIDQCSSFVFHNRVQNQIGSLLATSDKQRGELQMARDELAKAKAAYNSVISSTSKYEGEVRDRLNAKFL